VKEQRRKVAREWLDKNRASQNEKQRKRYATNPETRRRIRLNNQHGVLKARYGITPEQYSAMLESQGGVCAICVGAHVGGRSDALRFTVDHCHSTGAVRGLLCMKCNTGIGMLGDDPARLRAALAYLEKCKH
jgi:hypothetical protein